MLELSSMRKTPPHARLVGTAVGLLLGAAQGQSAASAGYLPSHAPWLDLMGQQPGRVLAEVRGCDPALVSNAAVHSLLAYLHRTPELQRSALEVLPQELKHRWAGPLAEFGLAVLDAAARCQSAEGRMPMDPATVLVCVDGSRLSFLALEVAASVRKHGKLVVLHVEEGGRDGVDPAPDMGVEFLETDLNQRCRDMLRIAPHSFEVVTVRKQHPQSSSSSGGGEPFAHACARVAQEKGADVVVLGCFGASGARIGTCGQNAQWGVGHVVDACCLLANPYSSPVPPLSDGGVDAMRPALFMVVVKAERPLNVRGIRATMRLMSHWHSLLVIRKSTPHAHARAHDAAHKCSGSFAWRGDMRSPSESANRLPGRFT